MSRAPRIEDALRRLEYMVRVVQGPNGADLIGAAVARFEAVRALHQPGQSNHHHRCAECGFPYPCQTILTLDGAQ